LKQAYLPSRTGIILNPAYLIRRVLMNSIRTEASAMHGILLDFGCGSRPYETLFTVEKYIGLDIENSGHPASLKRADIWYDGRVIPLPDSSVDHVFAAEVFEHVFNSSELFREILRVLKPGGTFLLTCPFIWPLHEQPYDFARYTPFALDAELEKAGFTHIRVRRLGHSVEAIFQLVSCYAHDRLLPRSNALRGILSLAYCTLLNMSALCMAKILPTDETLYLSNVVVAVKAKSPDL